MNEQLTARLNLLKQEFTKGQLRLQELERQEAALREALLRLSGAVEVLEEILAQSAPVAPTGDRAGDVFLPISRLGG